MEALPRWGKGVFNFKLLSDYVKLTGNEGGGGKGGRMTLISKVFCLV